MMKLEVDNEYKFEKYDTELQFIARVTEGLDSDGDYRIKVIESNETASYPVGHETYVSREMLIDYYKVTELDSGKVMEGIKFEVGKSYHLNDENNVNVIARLQVIRSNGEVFEFEVLKAISDNVEEGRRIRLIKSDIYRHFTVEEKELSMSEDEISSPIEMTLPLYHLYVDMALSTTPVDEVWLKELGEWRKSYRRERVK